MATNKLNIRACRVLYLAKEYDLLIGVDDLDEVDNILQEWALEKWGVVLDLPACLVYNKAITEVLTTLDITEYVYIQSPVAAYMEMPRYAGLSGEDLPIFPTILTDGKYVVPTCMAFLWSEPEYTGYFGEYIIPESQEFTLTTGQNYIGIHFNVGAPAYFLTDDITDFDYSSKIPVVTVLNFSSVLYVIPFGKSGYGLPEKMLNLNNKMKDLELVGDYTMTATDMYVQLSALTVKNDTYEIDCLAVDTEVSANDMYLHNKDSQGLWDTAKVTQINNLQYQSGSGLASLSAGEFVINYIFRVVDETNLLLFQMLSGKFSSLDLALRSSDRFDVPDMFKGTAIMVGRVIVEQNSTTPLVQTIQKYSWGVV